MSRRFAVLLALVCFVQTPVFIAAQTAVTPPANHPANPAKSAPATSAPATSASPDASSEPAQPPQIIVNPPSIPAPEWGWREQAAWGANILLAVLGYVGIMLALRTLKRIKEHVETGTATAQAAMEGATAALTLAQAIANSERPWIVVTVEPFLTVESSFKVMAANRGRSPARIVGSVDQVRITTDETQLPVTPEFDVSTQSDEAEPIVLLPGEATGIWAFNREDLPAICKTADSLKKVERWQATLFLYGRIRYMDLTAQDESQMRETYWCCRYIHGDKTSALVMAGQPAYNKHS
ncbi:MAG TPA: hypothetical protein VE291_03985 [Terracidiphilus sp.]|nr:hypothetical protein [Terracidiphilus sp.]